jgi:prephenate dehydrogenase/RimJ/RimL family protein N-acetyltransferase
MVNMSHGIVGAAGSMGTSLRCLLSGTGGEIICVDDDNSWPQSSDRTKLWSCDAIWLAIPRAAVDNLLKEKKGRLRPQQVVIDICSLKRGIARLVEDTRAAHLSLHPMHGPNIRRDRLKWFRIGPRDGVSEPADRVLTYLESLGVTFIDAESEEDHDFKMGFVLGLKEIMTIVMDRLIVAYARDCGKEQPTLADLLVWSSPVANAIYGAYVHSVRSSGNDLRAELVDGSYWTLRDDDSRWTLRDSASRALAQLATELQGLDLEHNFKNQHKRLDSELATVCQDDISAHINAWFEDAVPGFTGDRNSNTVQSSQQRGILPICTKNLTLRPYSETDRMDLVTILGDSEVMKWVFNGGRLEEDDALEFIDTNFVSTPGMGVLCHGAGSFLGFAGIIPCKPPLDGQYEFGLVLTSAAQSQKYGTEIGKKLIEVGLGRLRLERLHALCHPNNDHSIAWLAKLDMKPTGQVIPNYHGNEPRKVFVIER